MPDEPEMLTYAEVAQELGVSLPTLSRWMTARGIPSYRKIGDKRAYLRREDVDALRGWQPRDAKKAVA
jgi:excisionase family DNA binding protein